MGMTNTYSAIFALSIAIFIPFNNASPPLITTNPFCNTTENKTLCTSIVNGATTWPSATANAISETLKIAKQGKPLFDDLVRSLKDMRLSRISKESIGFTCNEIYDFAIECLHGALDDLRYGHVDRLATKLSSVTGPSSGCTNSVRKLGIDLQLSLFFSKLELYSRICLSITRAV